MRDWQGAVLDLVRREGAARRTTARVAAYGVNATGLIVMIAVFASTAFIPTGAEVGVAGGTTVLSQKVLEALFGDQAVRRLADEARADLLERVGGLLGRRGGAVRRRCWPRTPPTRRTRRRWSGPRPRWRRPDDGSALSPAGVRRRAVRTDSAEPVALAAARAGPGRRPRRGPARRGAARPGPGAVPPGRGAAAAVGRATPSSRWPAPPAAASRRCSTPWPGRRCRQPGVRRPTTGVAHAVVWDADGRGPAAGLAGDPAAARAGPPAGQDDLRGLVLLDLPDHDSTEVAHRLEVDRLVALVDVLVWVLDPQKYADAAIHDRYLGRWPGTAR